MKHLLTYILCSIFLISAFSQTQKIEFNGRYNPSLKKEKLDEAKFIGEIMPKFYHNFSLQAKDNEQFKDLLKIVDSPKGIQIYPQENTFFMIENYNKLMDFVQIEISAKNKGKIVKARSTGEALTKEQKNILMNVDLGSDVVVTIDFKYKIQFDKYFENTKELKHGEYKVTIVPSIEAEYIGGFKKFSLDFNEKLVTKNLKPHEIEKIRQSKITFEVNEKGKAYEVFLLKTSGDKKLDADILKAIKGMAEWKPAIDIHGKRVNQQFSISFEGGGC